MALTGASEIVDVSMLGLDRFDESGRSRLPADPIALPFPRKQPDLPGEDILMSTDAVTPAIDTALLAAAATAELEDWGPLEEATGEPMQTSGVTIWSSADGSQDAGIWQCTAGPSYWVQEENEFVTSCPAR